MSKKQVTYIDAAKFEAVIRELGIPVEEKKGWMKCLGPKGHAVYVPKTKTVGRVDVSWGAHLGMEGVLDLDASDRFGSVWAQLDMTRAEDEVLAAFRAVLEAMMSRTPRAVVRQARHKGPADAKGWSVLSAPQGDASSQAE